MTDAEFGSSMVAAKLDDAMTRRSWLGYAVVFVVAIALRLGWVLWIQRPGFPLNDSMMYHSAAVSVSRGNGYRLPFVGPTAQWPPGYPTLLAGLYRVFGISPTAGEVFNAVAGAATTIPLIVLGTKLHSKRVGLLAGLMFAVMPGAIMWTDVLVTETIYTAGFVTFLLAVSSARPTWGWAVALGAAIGVGALIRGEAMTWTLFPVVHFWPQLRDRSLSWTDFAARLTAAFATMAIVLSPWIIRNAIVMDAFVPVATNASQTLWSGHNPAATGGQTYPSEEFFLQFDQTAPHRELEASRALRSDALAYMATHPGHELKLIPLKLIHLMRGDSYILDWVNAVPDGFAPPLAPINVERIGVLADAAFFGLLTLTLLGAWWLGRRWWRQPIPRLIAAAFVTALVMYGFVYYGNYRYRFPLEPLMMLVAATFLIECWTRRPVAASQADVSSLDSEAARRA